MTYWALIGSLLTALVLSGLAWGFLPGQTGLLARVRMWWHQRTKSKKMQPSSRDTASKSRLRAMCAPTKAYRRGSKRAIAGQRLVDDLCFLGLLPAGSSPQEAELYLLSWAIRQLRSGGVKTRASAGTGGSTSGSTRGPKRKRGGKPASTAIPGESR